MNILKQATALALGYAAFLFLFWAVWVMTPA
jgi:hypothetical protein